MSVIVPNLRFSEFNEPWRTKTLGDFMTFKNGVNADKAMYGSGRKFINVLDVIASAPIFHDCIIGSVTVSDKEFAKNEVRYGDILFQRSSETREEVGQSNVYLDQDKTATFGGFVIRGRAIADFDPVFFHALLKTDKVRDDMTSRSGGSTRYNIGQDSLAAVPVHTPSLPEQQKIAAFLGAVDAKLAALAAKQAALERFKTGLMQKLFSQQLRFTRADGRAFPDWQEKRLGDVAQIVGGGTPESHVPNYWGGDIVWFTPTEVKSKYLQRSRRTISAEGLKNSSAKLLPVGALLLSTRATVGDVGIATAECCTNQGFQSLIVKAGHKNEFWYYWLLNNKKAILRKASGSTFLEIGKSEVVNLPVSVPHPDEQQKIANALSSMDAKIQVVADQVTKLQTFKKGLLQQMFV